MKPKIPTEHDEQVSLFRWAAASGIPELASMFAIPNGGQRHIVVAVKLRAEGVKPGVPDIFLPVPKGKFAGLFIEMKRSDGGDGATKEQRAWLHTLRELGYAAGMCPGWERARDTILNYLNVRDLGYGEKP